jgi:nitrogen fixation protein NifX
MIQRIAIASTDGENIDSHFAQARQFYIFDIYDEEYQQVEVRKSPGVLSHSAADLQQVVALLEDCTGIFVSKIGYGAAQKCFSAGLRVFEAPYSIQAVLNKVIAKQILANDRHQSD